MCVYWCVCACARKDGRSTVGQREGFLLSSRRAVNEAQGVILCFVCPWLCACVCGKATGASARRSGFFLAPHTDTHTLSLSLSLSLFCVSLSAPLLVRLVREEFAELLQLVERPLRSHIHCKLQRDGRHCDWGLTALALPSGRCCVCVCV